MAYCRTCRKQWPSGVLHCPDDGAALVGDSSIGSSSISGSAATAALAVAVPSDLPAGTMIGEYRVEGKLGEGGMGVVYAARHPLIGKRAAIKVISRELCASAEAAERFIIEAQSVNRIGHANIVDVFAFGTLPDGRSYFVMEWLLGENLRQRMDRGRMTLGEAAEILYDIAKALDAAHAAEVVHRDLKPDNVFLVHAADERPQVKLLDFGLAKLSGTTDMRAERTRTGVAMGTPLYISPEQARGRSITGATDVYALGAMAYEMIVGRPPFNAESSVEIMGKHIAEPPTPPRKLSPEVPPALDALLLRMLDKNPDARPSLAEVKSELAVHRAATTVTKTVIPDVAPRRRGKTVALVTAVVVAAAAAAVALAVTQAGGPDRDRPPEPASKPAVLETQTQPPTVAPPRPVAPGDPPTDVTPAAPAKGTLSIRVDVSEAQIVVDDHIVARKAGRATVELDAGDHSIEVTARRRVPYRGSVTVEAGQTQERVVRLERASARDRSSQGTDRPATTTSDDLDSLGDPFAGKGKR